MTDDIVTRLQGECQNGIPEDAETVVQDDIVTRLRDVALYAKTSRTGFTDLPLTGLVTHAADEIERLREELIQANNAIKLLIAIETAGKDS